MRSCAASSRLTCRLSELAWYSLYASDALACDRMASVDARLPARLAIASSAAIAETTTAARRPKFSRWLAASSASSTCSRTSRVSNGERIPVKIHKRCAARHMIRVRGLRPPGPFAAPLVPRCALLPRPVPLRRAEPPGGRGFARHARAVPFSTARMMVTTYEALRLSEPDDGGRSSQGDGAGRSAQRGTSGAATGPGRSPLTRIMYEQHT